MTKLQQAPYVFKGFCPIEPVPKGRPRFNSFTKRTYTPADTIKYENAVRKWLEDQYGFNTYPMDGALIATYEFVMKKPKSAKKIEFYDSKKPDIDNLVKSFQDAMDFKKKSSEGISLGVIANDSRISVVSSIKRYAQEGEELGTYFSIRLASSELVIVPNNAKESLYELLVYGIPKIKFEEIDTYPNPEQVKTLYYITGTLSKTDSKEKIKQIKKTFSQVEKLTVW